MKRIGVILVFFIACNTFSYSQKYRSFDSTTVWVTNDVSVVFTNCVNGRNVKYFIKGYEINNGRLWNKVYCNYNQYFVLCMSCPCTPPPPVINKLIGYYSNDTINKIVYYYPFTPLPPNYTPVSNDKLYNFYNKSVGDSLLLKNSPTYKFKINNIDSILFSGKYYKRYQTNCLPSAAPIYNSTISFIEGIGSSLGSFEPLIHSVGDQYSYLDCFSSPTQTVTVTNYTVLGAGACANITLNLNEIKEVQSSIYPSPNNGFFKIKIDNEIENGEIILYDSMGQKSHAQKIINGENNITTNDLAKGLYHYILLEQKQKISSGKLIIE